MIKVKNNKAIALLIAFLLFSGVAVIIIFWPGVTKNNSGQKAFVPQAKQAEIIIADAKTKGEEHPAKKPVVKRKFYAPDTAVIIQFIPLRDSVSEIENNSLEHASTAGLANSDFSALPTTPIPEPQAIKNKELTFFEPSQITNIALTGVNDFWALVNKPLNVDKKDSYWLLGAVGGTLLLSQLDEPIHKEVIRHPSLHDNGFTKFGDWYGRSGATYTVSLSLASMGLILKNKELVQTGLEVIESYFIANNVTAMLKRSFGRARPYTNMGNNYFTPFSSAPNGDNAFPSGHSTLAFSLSTVLASHVDNTYLKILIFTPAVATAVSRVLQNMHWTSDIFMGSAIGFFVGSFVTNNHLNFLPEKMLLVFDQNGNVGFMLRL